MSFVEGSYDQTGSIHIPPQGLYEISETKQARLGTRLVVGERVFRYAWASEALSKSKLACSLLDVDAEDTVTVAHPIGTFKVTVTAASAISANQYTDGYLFVDEGTGAGDVYRIKEHPAIGNGETGVVTLLDPLRTAWSTSDTDIQLIQSPYRLIEANTGQTELPAGVPLVAFTDEYYGWIQTWGPCCLLIDATGTFGAPSNERGEINPSSNVAGAVMKPTALKHSIGQVYTNGADYEDAKYQMVYLQICP